MTDTTEGNRLIAEFNSMGYKILANGTVVGKRGKLLKLHTSQNGYYQVNAYNGDQKKTFLLHRLIASAFIPNTDNLPEVNHIDGNKINNSINNLEWCTRSQNIKHGIDNGLIKKSMSERLGKKHWRAIPVIMCSHNGSIVEFESTGDAARKTGFNSSSIQDACKGRLKTYKGLKWRYKTDAINWYNENVIPAGATYQ